MYAGELMAAIKIRILDRREKEVIQGIDFTVFLSSQLQDKFSSATSVVKWLRYWGTRALIPKDLSVQ